MAITDTSTPQQDFATLERVRSAFKGDASPEYEQALGAITEKYGDLDALANAMGVPTKASPLPPSEPTTQRPEITREAPRTMTRATLARPKPAASPQRSAGALESIRAGDRRDLRRQPSDLSLPPPDMEPAPRRPSISRMVSPPPAPAAAPTLEGQSLPERVGREVRTKVTNLLEQGSIEAAERELSRRAQHMNPGDTAEVLNQIKAAREKPTALPEVFEGEATVRQGMFPEPPPKSEQQLLAEQTRDRLVQEMQARTAPQWLPVEIPGHGVVNFPGTMSAEEIGIAIRENFPEFEQGLTMGVLNNLAQSFVNGFGLTFKGVAGLQTFLTQSEALNVSDRDKLMVAPQFMANASDEQERERMFNELRRRARQTLDVVDYGRYMAHLHRIRRGEDPGPIDISKEMRFDPETKTSERALYRAAEGMREFAEETFPVMPENAENYLVQITGAAGYTMPILIGALVNPAVGVATAASMGSGEATEGAVNAGADESQIGLAAAMGTAPGAVDFLPVGNLFRIVRRVGGPEASTFWSQMARGAIEQGLIEGTTEGVQQFLQNGIAHLTYNPGHPLWEGVPEAIKIGAGAGAMFGLFGGSAAAVYQAKEQRQAQTMEQVVAQQQQELAEILEGEKTAQELAEEAEARPSPEQEAAETEAESAMIKEEATQESVAEAGLPEVGQKVEAKFPDGSVENLTVGAYETRPGGSIRVNLTDEAGEIAYTGDPGEIEMRLIKGDGTKGDPVKVETGEDVDRAAAVAAEPTPAQAESDNYPQGHMQWEGFDLSIETPAGGTRTDTQGRWQVDNFPAHYGKMKGTKGADKDHLDFYMGPAPESQQVVIIDQIDPETGKFDEHKIFFGFPEEGREVSVEDPPLWLEVYETAFSDGSGFSRIGDVRAMTLDEFRAWTKDGDTTKPFSYQEPEIPQRESTGGPVAGTTEPAPTVETQVTEAPVATAAEAVPAPPPTPVEPESVGEPGVAIEGPQAPTGAPKRPVRKGIGRGKGERIRGKRGAPPNVTKQDAKLLPFLARRGGVKDVGGELTRMDAQEWKLPMIPKLVQEGGMDPDMAREAAVEAGFLPEGSDLNDFYEAVRVALGGVPMRRPEDIGVELDELAEKRAATARDQMEDVASNLGIDISGLDDNAAAFRIAQELESQATPETAAQTAELIEDEADRLTREALAMEEISEEESVEAPASAEDIPFEPASPRSRPAEAGRAEPAPKPRAKPRGKGKAPDRDRAAKGRPAPAQEGGQGVIPGAEQISERELAERRMEGRQQPQAAQKPADEGLFDVAGRGQEEMFSAANKPKDIRSKFWKKSAVVREELAEVARRVNPNVNVRFVKELWGEGEALRAHGRSGARERIDAKYTRLQRLATIALENAGKWEARDSVYHELFHSLEEVLTPAEQKVLQERFPAHGGISHEERTAIAFAEWAVNKDQLPKKSPVRQAFEKIARFLRGAAAVFRRNGFRTYEDIFEEAYQGVIAQRMKPPAEMTVEDTPEIWDQATERLGALGWPEEEIRKLLMTDYDEVLQEREQYAVGRGNRTNKAGTARGTQKQEDIIEDLIYHDPNVPWWRQLRDAVREMTDFLLREWRQGIFDQFDAIAQLEKGVTGKVQNAVRSAYKMALRTQNLEGVMLAVLKAGPLEYSHAEGRFKIKDGWQDGGFEDIFKPLAEKGTLRLWKAWAVAVRANRLNREGREALMKDIAKKHGYGSTQEAIDELLKLGGDPMDPNYSGPVEHADFKTAWDKWQRFNRAILDMAESVGVITAAQRKVWEQADYIPFYRVIDEAQGPKGPSRIQGLANQRSPIRKLMGGKQQINDPIENMIMNMGRMIDTSFKTIAMQRIKELAEQTGAMEKVPKAQVKHALIPAEAAKRALEKAGVRVDDLTPAQRQQFLSTFRLAAPKDPDIISMMENGESVYYRVNDPMLLRSLTNLNQRQVGTTLQIFGMMKRLLTHTVTADPAFMLRNTIRDTLQAKVVTGEDLKFGMATAKGFLDALRLDPDLIEILAGGAGTGGFYKTGGRDVRRHLEASLKPEDLSVKQVGNVFRGAWENWQKVGYASENANRLAIYRSLRRKGVDHAEAIHQAQDLLNFSMHGDWVWIQNLIMTVPFMNARLQGLYRLGRAFVGGDPQENLRVPVLGWNIPGAGVQRVKIPGTGKTIVINNNTLARASILMILSMGYWFAVRDDERYQNLQRWNRDMYYHWWLGEGEDATHIRIPKPFEVGALFSTIPERLLDLAFNNEDPLAAKALGESMQHMFLDTFAFNPIPQAVKPLVEQWANHMFFFDRSIETQSDQTVSPELRYSEKTSETVRLLTALAPDLLGPMANSPKRLEALIRGYLGTMGSYALSAMDLVSREFLDEGEPVARRGVTDRPVARGFLPPGPEVTKWTEEFYDLREEVNRVWADVRARVIRNQIEEAESLMEEHGPLLAHRRQLNKIAKRLSELRRLRPAIVSSKELSGEEKRAQLDDLVRQQNELVKTTLEIRREIRAAERKQEE